MTPLLTRQLLYVTGKGGVGKTTVALALGLAAAARGRRTVVAEVGGTGRIPALFGERPLPRGRELALDEDLSAVTIEHREALTEWFSTLVPGPLVRVLTESNTFGAFADAAPGGKELATIAKAWELSQPKRWKSGREGYDLVVLDAPASGHGLGLLRTPATFADIARVGPLGKQAARVRDFLGNPERTAVVAVALPGELPVSETLELAAARAPDAVVLNALLPERFDADELSRLNGSGPERAARAAAGRAADQREQLERLRAGLPDVPLATLPFLFQADLDLNGVKRLALELEAQLA